jgi:hypothetical protein
VRKKKEIDVRSYVESATVLDQEASAQLCAILDWPKQQALLRVKVRSTPNGSTKPVEVCQAMGIAGSQQAGAPIARLARLGFGGATLESLEMGISAEQGMRKLLPVAGEQARI